MTASRGSPSKRSPIKKSAETHRATRSVTFRLEAPAATSVSIAGDFNQWNHQTKPLKQRKDGVWYVTLHLRPGAYQYKFVLNGREWIEDPARTEKALNTHGTYNSVCQVT